MKLAEIEIRNIFTEINENKDSDYFSQSDIVNAMLDEDYQDLETFQNDILEYIDDEINILNYTITDDDYQKFNVIIATLWDKDE